MNSGPCPLVGNCLPDDWLLTVPPCKVMCMILQREHVLLLSSNQLALYSELFQNHELMNFCEMQRQFTYF